MLLKLNRVLKICSRFVTDFFVISTLVIFFERVSYLNWLLLIGKWNWLYLERVFLHLVILTYVYSLIYFCQPNNSYLLFKLSVNKYAIIFSQTKILIFKNCLSLSKFCESFYMNAFVPS